MSQADPADVEVVRSWIEGAAEGYGPSLHIERETLMLSGWWHAAIRLAPDVFVLRDEEPREDSPVLEVIAAELGARGLRRVGGNHPLIQPLTYARLSLAGVDWTMWGPDMETAERALFRRVSDESLPRELVPDDFAPPGDFSAEMEGARRIAGLPPSILLTVGLDEDKVRALKAAMPECRFETRELAGIRPEACGDLRPAVVLVDARTDPGRHFVMELRAAACGRFLPVAALTDDVDPPLGADLALHPAGPVGDWRERILQFL